MPASLCTYKFIPEILYTSFYKNISHHANIVHFNFYTEIDECDIYNTSCWNNATCVNQINNFTCLCMLGFTGRFCETSLLNYLF